MKISFYTSVLNQYNLLYLMLWSLCRTVKPEEFHKIYIVADGTTDQKVLNFLHECQFSGFEGWPPATFHIIRHPVKIGPAASLNYIIRLLDDDEGLFPTNAIWRIYLHREGCEGECEGIPHV